MQKIGRFLLAIAIGVFGILLIGYVYKAEGSSKQIIADGGFPRKPTIAGARPETFE